MALKTTELHGITPDVADKLRSAGITKSDELLDALAQPADRKALAAQLGMDERALLELGNRADLARIKGIGTVYSDLLEFAGVDTVAELATRVPDHLFAKLQEVASQHRVIRLPRPQDVAGWISQANELDRKLYY